MADLAIRLDERQRADKFEAIDLRGRAAFLEGAEAQSQAAEGRPLTATSSSGSEAVSGGLTEIPNLSDMKRPRI
jgi:hypothetical protein